MAVRSLVVSNCIRITSGCVISVKACWFIVRRIDTRSVKEVIGQKSNGNPEKRSTS